MTESPSPLIGGGVDSVIRLKLFEAAHLEVKIVPPADPFRDRWRAIVHMGSIPGEPETTTLGDYRLTGLLDRLDEIFPPGSGE